MDFSTHSLRAGTFITHSRLELQQHRLLSDNPLLRRPSLLFSLQLNDLLLKSMDFSTHSLRAGTFITHSRLELQQHRLLSDNPLLRRPSLLFSRRQFLFFVEQRQQKGKVPAANRLLPDRIQPV